MEEKAYLITPLGKLWIEENAQFNFIESPGNLSYKKYSRVYGYRYTSIGKIEIVEEEARVIGFVNTYLATTNKSLSDAVDSLLRELNKRDIRNRSGKRFIKETLVGIKGLVRPIFAGVIFEDGILKKSKYYPPIISMEVWKAAENKLIE